MGKHVVTGTSFPLCTLHFDPALEYCLPTWRLWKFPDSLWKLLFGWTTIQSDSLETEMTWWFWKRRPLQPRILECIHQRFELLNCWCRDLIFPIFYVNISKCVAKLTEKAMAPHSSTFAWRIPWTGGAWWAVVHVVVKSQTQLSDFPFTFHFHKLEKEMATHSSVLAWRIPGMGEPGGLPSMGSHRIGHDWRDLAAAAKSEEFYNKHLHVHHLDSILTFYNTCCVTYLSFYLCYLSDILIFHLGFSE